MTHSPWPSWLYTPQWTNIPSFASRNHSRAASRSAGTSCVPSVPAMSTARTVGRSLDTGLTRRLFHFAGKILEHRQRRIRGGLTEAADGRIHHRLRQLLDERPIPSPLLHEVERLHGAHPAG